MAHTPSYPAPPAGLPQADALDTQHESEFDRAARVATRALGAPVAQFNVVTAAEQVSASSVGPAGWRGRRAVSLEASYCQHVVRTGEPLVIDDARTHPLVRDNRATTESGVVAYAGVPVVLPDGAVAGSLCVVDFVPRAWTAEDRALLEDLAASVAAQLQLARHAEALRDAQRALETRVAERTAELTRANADLRASNERFRAIFDQAAVGIAAADAAGRFLRANPRLCDIVGYSEPELCAITFRDITHPDDVRVDAEQRARLLTGELDSYQVMKRYVHKAGHVVWALLTTSVVRGPDGAPAYFLGVIEDVTERRRTAEDLRLAKFEVVERLAQAAEFRDDDTGQHTRRVGELSARLAEAFGLPAHEVELIRRAAPLHDVGKIGVPDGVLLKPGRLTTDEFDVMKRHTLIGAELLAGGSSPLMAMAETIARSHHERWDGAGYPERLAGEAIPLPARIVAVVDFYDALSSDRPYRPAWSRERVLAEIERGIGTHFDPRVARTLLRLLEDSAGAEPLAARTAPAVKAAVPAWIERGVPKQPDTGLPSVSPGYPLGSDPSDGLPRPSRAAFPGNAPQRPATRRNAR